MAWFSVGHLGTEIEIDLEPKHFNQVAGRNGQTSITFSSRTPGEGTRFVESVLRRVGFDFSKDGPHGVSTMECEMYKAFIVEERMWWHKPVGKRLRTVRVDIIHRKYL